MLPVASFGQGTQHEQNYVVRFFPGNFTPSNEYLEFIANHYQYIIIPASTHELISEIREINPNIKPIFYRNFIFIDTTGANYPEEYYAHNTTDTSNHNPNQRIIKRERGVMYLMNISSQGWQNEIVNIIDSAINYLDYSGFMVDDCGPGLETRIDFLPDNYTNLETWLAEIKDFLGLIRNEVDNDSIFYVFNGIYNNIDYPNRDFLEVTDGGIKEGFIFHLSSGIFIPEDFWVILLNWILTDTQTKYHIASAKILKANGDTATLDERMFAFTSYLLIKNTNVKYSPEDWGLVTGLNNSIIQYYPEMDIDLGNPTQSFLDITDAYNLSSHLYERSFDKGKVLVNPSSDSIFYELDKAYYLVIPQGGGIVNNNGSYGDNNTSLLFELVNNISLPPQSGLVLLDSSTNSVTNLSVELCPLFRITPNPFNKQTKITYQLLTNTEITICVFNINGENIRTLLNKYQQCGIYNIIWEGNDDYGNLVSSGTYFCQIRIGKKSIQTKKLLLLK